MKTRSLFKKLLPALMCAVALTLGLLCFGSASASTTAPWDGNSEDTGWYNYNNTAAVIEISTPAELAGLAALVNDSAYYSLTNGFAGTTFILTADIDLNNKTWAPIGKKASYPFYGTFDGNGHTISGMNCTTNTVSSEAVNLGLFGCVGTGGTVRNVKVKGEAENTNPANSTITYVGGIVAFLRDGGTVQNCISDVAVTGSVVGGIAGRVEPSATVENCRNIGTVTGSGDGSDAGGIAGYCSNSTVKNCQNTAAVTADGYSALVGGIAGYADESTALTACLNTGAVTAADGTSGGILGYAYGASLTACYDCGGNAALVGNDNSGVTACYYLDGETVKDKDGAAVASYEAAAAVMNENTGTAGVAFGGTATAPTLSQSHADSAFWSSDETGHWKECVCFDHAGQTCPTGSAAASFAAHSANLICRQCGFVSAPEHYLTFSSENTFTLKTDNGSKNWDGTLYYSTDAAAWAVWDGKEIASSADGKLYLCGEGNTRISDNGSDERFVLTGTGISCTGNIETLLDQTAVAAGEHPTMATWAFANLFYQNAALISAPELPAEVLTERCYSSMFYGCTSLKTAPALPAETLAEGCYSGMFRGCTSLETAPVLPAENLSAYCYNLMFFDCTALKTAPELPATVLTEGCYYAMFQRCTALETAPSVLPAETLTAKCYYNMFYDCTSLKNAPELPATTLAANCYYRMFYNCASLTEAPALPAETLTDSCYYGMFYGCTSLKTAPELNATVLAPSCYRLMFSGCTSLKTAPALSVETLAESCYQQMFYNCTGLETAPELPATTLAANCYQYMFSYCTALETAPELSATTLAANCYQSMFSGCKALESAPALPAKTLAESCYNSMFFGCKALESAPALPAETLAERCYNSMFYGCTGLESAPALPATTLAAYCYQEMFAGCTALEIAPELPATELADYCYYIMFSGCTALESAPKLPATILAVNCYQQMFYNCTALKIASELPADTLAEYCYRGMFSGCSGLEKTPELPATELADYCYYMMFSGCTVLKTVPVELPATTLTAYCYASMFSGCTALETAPELPAMTLAKNCYRYMFSDCTALEIAPKLPATALADYCYASMFSGCTALKSAPELPATTLAASCYHLMFDNCTGLETAPELPATTLAESCYDSMFVGCTGLKTAPELPATTLAEYCYYSMFFGCTGLKIAPELPATTLATSCYDMMFYGCKALCISDVQSDIYNTAWSFPAAADATGAVYWNFQMFYGANSTFTDDPQIGTTYYLHTHSFSEGAHDCACGLVHSHDGGETLYFQFPTSSSELTQGGLYYLADNVTLTNSINIFDDVTLCLNGKILQMNNGTTGYSLSVGAGVTLTVSDCGTAGKIGCMPTEALTNASGYDMIDNRGLFVLEGGTVEKCADETIGCIDNHVGATLAVTGGTLTAGTDAIIQNDGIVTVSGGTLTGYISNRGILTVSGGKLNGYILNGDSQTAGELQISGGVIESTGSAAVYNDHADSALYLSGTPTVNGAAADIDRAQAAAIYAHAKGDTAAVYGGEALTLSVAENQKTLGNVIVMGVTDGNKDKFTLSNGGLYRIATGKGERSGDLVIFFSFAGEGTEESPYIVTTAEELQAAVDGTENETNYIKLGGNIELTASLNIGTSAVIDLNGKTVTGGCFETGGDSVTFTLKNGTLTGTTQTPLQVSGATVVLKDMTVTASGDGQYALAVSGGTVTATNVTLSGDAGIYNQTGGTLTVDGVSKTGTATETSYHTHGDADGDCVCDWGREITHSYSSDCDSVCNNNAEHTRTAPSSHTPNTDDGNCTTDILCSLCGEVTASGNAAHTYTYSASGNVITETCANTACTAHTATATVSAPTALTYDGTAKTASVSYSDGWQGGTLTVTYNMGTAAVTSTSSAGTYTASVTKGGETATVNFTVAPKTVANATVTVTVPQGGFVYDGTAFKPTVKVFDGDTELNASEYTVAYTNNTNAGTATVTVSDAQNGNYTVSGTATFAIAPKEIVIDWTEDDFTYNGTDQKAGVTATYDGVDGTPVALTVTSPAAFKDYNAEGYVFTASFAGGETNYKLPATVTKTYHIQKATPSAPTGLTPAATTYIDTADGKITGVTEAMEYKLSGASSYTAVSGTEIANLAAGTYQIRFAATANHNASAATTVTVALGGKRTAILTFKNDLTLDKTYNASAVTLANGDYTYTGDGEVTVTWYADNAGTKGDALTGAPANAGTYWVGIGAAEGDTYNAAAQITKKFTIGKATYDMSGVSFADGVFTYDGTQKSIAVSGTLPSGVTVQYSAENAQTDATASPVTVTASFTGDSTNYHAINAMTATITVNKANATITVDTTPIVKTYGDVWTLPTATANFGTVVCDKVIGDLVNANTYTVTYTVAGTANYNGDTKTVSVTVNKATVNKPSADTTVFTYTGAEQTYTVAPNSLYTVSGTTRTDAGSQEVTVALADKANYEWADGSVSDVTFTFAIAKADQAAPAGLSPAATTYIDTADGKITGVTEAMEYKLSGADGYTAVSGTEIANLAAGTYQVRFAATANHNASADATVTVALGGKRTATLTFKNDLTLDKTYNASAVTLANGDYTYTGDGEVTVTWYADNAGTKGDALTGAPVNAGTYWVGVGAAEGNTYNAAEEITKKFVIAKETFDLSGITFENKTVIANGEANSILIGGTLPDGVTVTYEGNGKTEAGVYTVTATFACDTNNYNAIAPMTATLTVNRAEIVDHLGAESETPQIIVTTEGGFAPDIEIVVTELSAEGMDLTGILKDGEVVGAIFDITMKSGDDTVQPTAPITVKLLIPASLADKEFRIIHKHGDEYGEVAYTVENGYAVFTVADLSEFIFAYEKPEEETSDGTTADGDTPNGTAPDGGADGDDTANGDKSFPWWGIVLIVAAAAIVVPAAGFAVHWFAFKKKTWSDLTQVFKNKTWSDIWSAFKK